MCGLHYRIWHGILCTTVFICLSGVVIAGPVDDYELGRKAYLGDDLISAMDWLRKAADQEYAPAQVLLAYIMDKAEENEAAIELYRAAAEQGNVEGELGLGVMYAAGEGVERDQEQALYWIQRSAEHGHAPAMEVLAGVYLRGELGLPVNRDRAVSLLQQAADSGHAPAKVRLEEMMTDSSSSESGKQETAR